MLGNRSASFVERMTDTGTTDLSDAGGDDDLPTAGAATGWPSASPGRGAGTRRGSAHARDTGARGHPVHVCVSLNPLGIGARRTG
jgi:hypothetical protein